MKTLIAIPSRSRPHMLERTVIPWLFELQPYPANVEVKFFVEPQQRAEYSLAIPPQTIAELPENDRGLQYSLNYIHTYAKNAGYDLVFKIDDDTSAWCRRSKRSDAVASARHFSEVLHDSIPMFLRYDRLGGIGFPYSFEMYELKRWASINARLQSNYLVRTEFMITPYEKVFEWDDFYRYLRILNQNSFVLRYGYAGIEADVGTLPGGAQDFPRQERAKKTRLFFQQIWPELRWKQVNKPWLFEPDFRATPNLRSRSIETLPC